MNTTGGGATYQTIPAPGGCTTPPAPMKDPIQGGGAPMKDPVQGGGAVAGVNGAALAPILTQLTGVIGQLSSLVGGVSGGGAPGKTPAQSTTQGGGAAPAPTSTNPAPATPPASTVAGANGAGAANAAAGASQVQGGGGVANNEALVKALQGVIESLNALIKALGGQVGGVTGGGAPGKTPEQGPPGKGEPPAPPKGDVAGAHDHPPVKQETPPAKTPPVKQEPPKVGGESGPGKDPGQTPPTKTPPPVAVPPSPPTSVGGEQGPGQKPTQTPTQTPVQGPPPKVEPPKVGGENGGPTKPPVVEQKPPTKPPVVIHKGNVRLDNDDDKWSAKLSLIGAKADTSVELWGDPHVVITENGKTEKFDIGAGVGKITLFDGTVVSWNTYDKGEKVKGDDRSFILENFKVDSPGKQFDQSVTTRDRDGNKGDEMNLPTALTDAHLREIMTALRTMKGDFNKPLQHGTWVSPAYQKPTQGGGNVVQQVTQK